MGKVLGVCAGAVAKKKLLFLHPELALYVLLMLQVILRLLNALNELARYFLLNQCPRCTST
jgi:hypothetical protein